MRRPAGTRVFPVAERRCDGSAWSTFIAARVKPDVHADFMLERHGAQRISHFSTAVQIDIRPVLRLDPRTGECDGRAMQGSLRARVSAAFFVIALTLAGPASADPVRVERSDPRGDAYSDVWRTSKTKVVTDGAPNRIVFRVYGNLGPRLDGLCPSRYARRTEGRLPAVGLGVFGDARMRRCEARP